MNLKHIWRISLMFVFLFTFNVPCDSSSSLNLENIVQELQIQVKELQKVRQEDSETIRKLHEKVHRYVTEEEESHLDFVKTLGASSRMSEESWRNAKSLSHDLVSLGAKESELRRLDKELQNLRLQLLLAVESGENRGPNMKTEVAIFRQEILQLRKMVEEIDARRKDEAHSSSGRVAVRWLQRTVEDLRHEMKEMASSLNTSAVLADKQGTETKIDLLRSDVSSLGHRMDSVRVDRERNAALIQQLRQDVDELRTRLQEFAVENRKLIVELDSLKEEFREQSLNYQRNNPMFASHRTYPESEISTRNGGKSHPKLRHGHWKAEADMLHEIIGNLEQQQSELVDELKVVRKDHSISILKLEVVEKTCFHLLNKSEPIELEQRVMNQRVEILESIVNKTERQTLDIQSRVNNITSSGIKKLHGSTMQLFEALERLESNHDRTTADIRREMSKLDYNLSQTQSDMEELRERQLITDEVMSSVKSDVETAQSESKKNHLRILLVQSAVLNRTLQNTQYNNGRAMQDAKISALETKIGTLSHDVDVEKTEIEALHRQVIEKADEHDLTRWEKIQRKVRESILEFKEDIPRIKRHQEKFEIELEKFAEQLPADCSLNSPFENVSGNKSGTYLIHPAGQTLHPIALKVYCDMDTSGGQWTVIQRRSKGDHSFEQDWKHYKEGFGDVTAGDFWLGNDILHQMTTSNDYSLRIDLWDSMNKYRYAEYSTFRVLDETDNYRLVLAGYRGNASDAMEYHNGMPFSTPDRDNDASSATHCGRFYGSGWWYNHCQYVNINGRFNTGITWYNIEGQEWSELTKVEMKIKLRTLVYL